MIAHFILIIIPIILQALETRGLDISLQIHEADLDELNTLLVQGTIDVSLTYNMFPNPSIEFETLIEEKPYVMIARMGVFKKRLR